MKWIQGDDGERVGYTDQAEYEISHRDSVVYLDVFPTGDTMSLSFACSSFEEARDLAEGLVFGKKHHTPPQVFRTKE